MGITSALFPSKQRGKVPQILKTCLYRQTPGTGEKVQGQNGHSFSNIDFTLVLRTAPAARGMLQVASTCPFRPTLHLSPPCSGPEGRPTWAALGSIALWPLVGLGQQGVLAGDCEKEGGWGQALPPLAPSLVTALPSVASLMSPPFLPLSLGW